MAKSIKFYTLGCKTNQYETQALREGLISSGSFVETDPSQKADIYIVNTCTVTAKADRKCRALIRHCYKENPDAQIVATGCLTEMDADMIKDLPGISFVVKNNEKHKIRDILTHDARRTTHDERSAYTPLKISNFRDRTKAFVKVQDGCDNSCAFCKIPLVRGHSRSRRLGDIIEEIDRLLERGFKELVLTGICLGGWGRDLNQEMKLSYLIEKINVIDRNFRVRLSSIEPNMVSDELIETIAKSEKVCPHLHIPLQSGSTKILRLMNRPYAAEDFMKLIKKVRRTIPGVSITSDVMVGFPGESKKDFKETAKVIRSFLPSRLHIFTYSKRNGTLAARYKNDIDSNQIKRRRRILKDIAEEVSYKYRRDFINRRVEGLVETRRDPKTSLLTGYTDTYIKFLLDGPDSLMGMLIPLKVRKAELKSTYCVPL